MKKIFFFTPVIFLIFATTITKNSTKQLDRKIFETKENIRVLKDKYELDCIRIAVEVTDKVYEEILPMLSPGYTEKDVANAMVSKYRKSRI